MAQFSNDFSQYSLNESPSDFTAWVDGSITALSIQNDGAGVPVLVVSPVGGGTREAYTWDAVPLTADAEVYTEFSFTNGLDRDCRVALRLDPSKNTSGATATMYVAGARPNNEDVQIAYYNDGNTSQIQSSNFTFSGHDYYKQLVQISGNIIRSKVWGNNDSEPSTWHVDDTESSIADAGLIGLFSFTGGIYRISFMGVGTGSDSAPREMIQSTPPSITLDSTPVYGEAISGTYANFGGTPTGPLQADDGTRQADISISVDSNNETFTGTFPALPAAGQSLPAGSLPYPGSIDVTLPDPGE